MKFITNNAMEPVGSLAPLVTKTPGTANKLPVARCGAKTRSGAPCRSPVVRGRSRCRMHGGANPGAPKGNSNARKHGNRSREAEEQLKLVRQADMDLRIHSKILSGKNLTPRELQRMLDVTIEQRRRISDLMTAGGDDAHVTPDSETSKEADS